MNANFKTKLLLKLANKKADKGFTLIELLVVTIIVGVLAAVALPNLLNQVGKAREVEAKNGMGAINRAQQAFHFERKEFADGADPESKDNELGVVLKSKYYTFDPTDAPTGADTATAATTMTNPQTDGVRGYAAAIGFNEADGQYNTAICQSNKVGTNPTATADTTASTCDPNSKKIEG